jgi:ABC-2 type transport system permease protein
VSSHPFTAPGRAEVFVGELRKLPAFGRRDFLTAWSYRASFLSDIANLGFQVVMFYFIGRMVNTEVLPSYDGAKPSYMEFVVVGIALGVFLQLGMGRVANSIRGEQLMGTLESLFMTPTSTATLQVGSAVYDLIYIPIRTALFFLAIALMFGLDLHQSGYLPAAVMLLIFIPFVWGLGITAGAAILTFKRGSGGVGFGVAALTLGSGAYFPLTLFPGWVEDVAYFNPMAIAIGGMRNALLGGDAWAELGGQMLLLVPMSFAMLGLGIVAFRLALRRERGRGSMGLY